MKRFILSLLVIILSFPAYASIDIPKNKLKDVNNTPVEFKVKTKLYLDGKKIESFPDPRKVIIVSIVNNPLGLVEEIWFETVK